MIGIESKNDALMEEYAEQVYYARRDGVTPPTFEEFAAFCDAQAHAHNVSNYEDTHADEIAF